MAWMADDSKNMRLIVSSAFLDDEGKNIGIGENLPSNSDSEPDVLRGKFSAENITQPPSTATREPLAEFNAAQLYKCWHCDLESRRLFNLRRHGQRHHKDKQDQTPREQTKGNSVCLQCGQRFHKIKQLRKYLEDSHKTTFRIENLSF